MEEEQIPYSELEKPIEKTTATAAYFKPEMTGKEYFEY